MERYTLNNKIEAIVKRNKNTPRIAIVMYIRLNEDEKYSGLYFLLTQLLLQGTKNRNSEQLAIELDENAIDLNFDKKADYIRFKVQCLNEDINKALEILQDIIENTTFDDYKKEIGKIKGEFKADLDSAKVQAQDTYYRTIFKNHPYGIGRKEMMEGFDLITKEDILTAWDNIRFNSQKNIAAVGDIEPAEVIELLNKHLSCLKVTEQNDRRKQVEAIEANRVALIEKEDANQAQIFQGWIFPSIYSPDYATISLLNTILGSSGLSSRLYLELREKQGLAYTVRSVWEPYRLSGNFFVYIATEPKNIDTSIKGIATEINKITTELISDEELERAKSNTIGKRQFYQQTNLSEASLKGYYEYAHLGFDFAEEIKQSIQNVTKEQLMETAKRYFATNTAMCVLAPKKYLSEAGLI
jgi:zinc protease